MDSNGDIINPSHQPKQNANAGRALLPVIRKFATLLLPRTKLPPASVSCKNVSGYIETKVESSKEADVGFIISNHINQSQSL